MKSYTKMYSNIGGYIGTIVHPKDGKIVGKIIGGSIGAYFDYLAGNSKLIAEWMVESAREIREYSFNPNDFL